MTASIPLLLASSGLQRMLIPTPEPRRPARLLPRPRACDAACAPGVARRWPTRARVLAVPHAPTLQIQVKRPVC